MLDYKYHVYVDVETTGFDPIRNDIVSIAMIVTDREFNKKAELYETVRPDFNKFYSEEAEKVHGFTREQSSEFQDQRQACIKILHFLKPFKHDWNVPQLFVSHCLKSFDYNFVNWMFMKQGLEGSLYKVLVAPQQRSTIIEARKAGHTKNSLDVWAQRLGLELEHHNAMSDTMACVEIDKHLMRF